MNEVEKKLKEAIEIIRTLTDSKFGHYNDLSEFEIEALSVLIAHAEKEPLTEEEEEVLAQNERFKSALHLITFLSEKRDMHLGRPRSSDMHCIFCVAYLSENYGAYGERITKE